MYLKVQGIQKVPKGPGFWGGTNKQTHKQTNTHINTMTRPGLRDRLSETWKKVKTLKG